MNLGINLVGASYGVFPTNASIDYYAAKGFTQIRLPFSWEQVQPTLGGPLDKQQVASIKALVDYAASVGMEVVLDIHNQGAYNGALIGSPGVPPSSFADVWSKLATQFADSPNVVFGLMNEPQQKSAAEWLSIVNSAIDAIRDTGADQKILVPGVNWTGAWNWIGSDNGKIIGAPGAVVDPLNNYAFEVHQYLDNTSGKHDWVVSETIGVERLQAITQWARATGAELYLGEFGVAANQMSLTALKNMMDFLEANQDVWQSASYWAGGPSWNDYMYAVEPELGLLDAPQMDVLEQYTDARTVFTSLSDGGNKVETFLPGSDRPSMVDIFDANDNLVSRSLYSGNGKLDRVLEAKADGSYVVTDYTTPGKALPATVTTYTAEYEMVVKSQLNLDGTSKVDIFDADSGVRTREETYNAKGQITQATDHDGDGHVLTKYNLGKITSVEHYAQNWTLECRDTYNANGVKVSSQFDFADGTHVVAQFNLASGLVTSRIEYSSKWAVLSRSEFDGQGNLAMVIKPLPDGTRTIDHYKAGSADLTYSERLTSDYKLISKVVAQSDGHFISDIFATPGGKLLASREVYNADWSLDSRTTYDSAGKITTIQHELETGQHKVDTYTASNQTHASQTVVYDANWQVDSRSAYDTAGRLTQHVDVADGTGYVTVHNYVAGTTKLASIENYTAGSKLLLDRTKFDAQGNVASFQQDHADGTHTVVSYTAANQAHPSGAILYDAAWNVVNRSVYDASGNLAQFIEVDPANGNIALSVFTPGTTHVAKLETYTAGWKTMLDRTTFDSQGNIKSVQLDNADGSHTVTTYTASANGHTQTVDVFSSTWKMASRSFLNEDGLVHRIEATLADGTKTLATFQVPGSAYATKLMAYSSTGELLSVKYPAEEALFAQAQQDDVFHFTGGTDVGSDHVAYVGHAPLDDGYAVAPPIYDLVA